MSTSDRVARPMWLAPGRRVLEASALAALLAFVPEWLRLRAGVTLIPHPGWIAVLVLSARDGSAGLLAGLIASAVAVGLAALAAGLPLAISYERLTAGPNLIACAACLAVSWIASWHLRQQAELVGRLRESTDQATDAQATVDSLRDVAARLRERVDRASTSLSFLRDVATRLDGRDPVAAAEAAGDLALTRTGASAVAVKVGPEGFRRLLAVRDARGPRVLEPLTLREADLTVPIRSANQVVGVVALWGVTRAGLDDSTAHDLSVIASWCAPAIAGGRLPAPEAGRVRSAS